MVDFLLEQEEKEEEKRERAKWAWIIFGLSRQSRSVYRWFWEDCLQFQPLLWGKSWIFHMLVSSLSLSSSYPMLTSERIDSGSILDLIIFTVQAVSIEFKMFSLIHMVRGSIYLDLNSNPSFYLTQILQSMNKATIGVNYNTSKVWIIKLQSKGFS